MTIKQSKSALNMETLTGDQNIKVAVRVRPFNEREKKLNAKLVVDMKDNQTILKKSTNEFEPKLFTFDYSYWSHDSFKVDKNGINVPETAKYCDQKRVFNDIGISVLENAWDGFNATLFAYGQTGSGKSYSISGYGPNKGIVPLICEEIFSRIKNNNAKNDTQFEVTFSMLEIYNELVRDLIALDEKSKKNPLQIRESKSGFFAAGLRKQLVSSYQDIEKLINDGNKARSIGSTQMNNTSSRAHTITTIQLSQKYKINGLEMTKISNINLVDLAGSERIDNENSSLVRKEGVAINLSLVFLGNVISALAANSNGKSQRVPYRESVLTKLLMNALGGNSKTIMIAAISPADLNYEESLSTLRYADRAKQIKCKPIVNESQTDKLIKSLKEECEQLKRQLEEVRSSNTSLNKELINTHDEANDEDNIKQIMKENEKRIEEMMKSYEEKLAEAKSMNSKQNENDLLLEKAKKYPHLTNINMDPVLSGSVIISLDGESDKRIGAAHDSHIKLTGLGINMMHGVIRVKEKGTKFTIERCGDSKILKNGSPVLFESFELNHMDRLIFGTSQYFVFKIPSKISSTDPNVTFELMQDEITKFNDLSLSIKNIAKELSEEALKNNDLIYLIQAVEEANLISKALDKNVTFEILALTSESLGVYDETNTMKPYVYVKNHLNDLEYCWTRDHFMDRFVYLSEYYSDFMDDGIINRDKFINFDPFVETQDTPTQIGTLMIFEKCFKNLLSRNGIFNIINIFGDCIGKADIEIYPCDDKGNPLTEYSQLNLIHDPNKDLLDKRIHFILKINRVYDLKEKFDGVYCQFSIFNDTNVYKTQVVYGSKNFDIKYQHHFTYLVDEMVSI